MFVEFLEDPPKFAEAVTGGDCDSVAPEGEYECTLQRGHYTTTVIHKAGIPGNMVVAEWDDDRSTDSA